MKDETRITLRLPSKLHDALKRTIKDSRRSLNSEIVFLLEKSLKSQKDKR
jgi:hypothetical protein